MNDPFDELDAQIEEQAAIANARLAELEDLRALLAEGFGRRIVNRILARAGIYRTSFNVEAMNMAFLEGRRDMGIWLQSELLEADPTEFYHAMQERNDD